MNHPNFENQEYLDHLSQIRLVNDFYNGVDTAKNHINKFDLESDTSYTNRLKEAKLSNYVFKTVDTIKNIIFRKAIDTKNIQNNQVALWCEKINFKDDLDGFAKKVLKHRVRDGFTYILVDSPSYDSSEIRTKADLEKNNIRPYFVNILRNKVINWELDKFEKYIRFSIRETYQERVGIYGVEYKEQIRMYEIVDGKVEVSIWRENKEVSRERLTISIIPIVKVGNDLIPPLYDQTKINVSHLNRNSEKSNYVRVGGSPIPLIWGDEETSSQKTLGISSGIRFNGTKNETGAEWWELKGNNYDMIQREIEYLESQMEAIGVDFVTELKNATATEVEKMATARESKLSDYALELEHALNKALELMGLYYDGSLGENYVSVNKDFDSNIITPEQANLLLNLRTQNVISYDLLLDMLIQGELIPYLDEKERETEKLRLRDEGI